MKILNSFFLFFCISHLLNAQTSLTLYPKNVQELMAFKGVAGKASRISSTNGLKCRLDSSKTKGYSSTLGFYNTTKRYYYYDANDNCTSNYDYAYDTLTLNWFKTYKYTSSYNSQNFQQDIILSVWSTASNSYETTFKLKFNANAANTVTLILQQDWSGTQWLDVARTTITVSTTQKSIEEINQTWNATNSTWENQWRVLNAYTLAGDNSDAIFMNWNNSAWVNNSKTTLTYDANHNNTGSTDYSWNSNTSNWDLAGKSITSYTSNFDLLSVLNQSWDAITNSYVNQSRRTCTYNSSNIIIDETFQQWNPSGSAWINTILWIWTYDTNNNLYEILIKYWDSDTETWINSSDNFSYHNCREVATTGLSHEFSSAKSFLVYPNPATEVLNLKTDINFSSIQIISVTGEVIFESAKTFEINTTHFSKGLYFIRLLDETNKAVISRKFLRD